MQNKYLLRLVFLWWMNGCIAQNIQTINNCTCQTSNGSFYSLWPFKGIKKPRFPYVPGKKYKDWLYAYNPCTSMTFHRDDPDPKTLCHDIGICQYAKVEKPREYHQVGVQTGVRCALNKEGQIELVYKTKDKTIDPIYSTVQLICEETAQFPSFEPKDEDNYIFTIKTRCACPDQCWPPVPEPTTPEPITPTSVVPSPMTVIPTTTSNSTEPSSEDSKVLKWKLYILLSGLTVVLLLCFICLWWRVAAVREALRCRYYHCCGENVEPDHEYINNLKKIGKTKLIKNKNINKTKYKAVEDIKGEDKLDNPVQEGDVGDKTQVVKKDNV
ncbi:uncharacterized protein LOC111325285 isoform X1 [Stylophora pistillata]|uniref:uncharacterized protein LOC111325285 isoform X1 n=1 Tax=Stylophora pistillata TaxID=50429 RepID=UPI000C05389F|nr:uncharacterized protein LOC111325285 isoform X1 [Stylophora pistillata]XP_022784807.1 uncharacterized protein LOC111325285 isoform X1 [Stylophora pistillata]XP_022784810.1 uncharacterized protein LOC111325285 isoform X1 [Stylophora pistillata]